MFAYPHWYYAQVSERPRPPAYIYIYIYIYIYGDCDPSKKQSVLRYGRQTLEQSLSLELEGALRKLDSENMPIQLK